MAGAGPAPVSRLRSSIRASYSRASCTSRAAGRACRPCRLVIFMTADSVVRAGDARPSAGVRSGRLAAARGADVELLGGQGADRLGGDLGRAGATGGGDGGDDQALDQRRGAEDGPLADGRVDHVERHLGRQDGAAEVHQDHDARRRRRPR